MMLRNFLILILLLLRWRCFEAYNGLCFSFFSCGLIWFFSFFFSMALAGFGISPAFVCFYLAFLFLFLYGYGSFFFKGVFGVA